MIRMTRLNDNKPRSIVSLEGVEILEEKLDWIQSIYPSFQELFSIDSESAIVISDAFIEFLPYSKQKLIEHKFYKQKKEYVFSMTYQNVSGLKTVDTSTYNEDSPLISMIKES